MNQSNITEKNKKRTKDRQHFEIPIARTEDKDRKKETFQNPKREKEQKNERKAFRDIRKDFKTSKCCYYTTTITFTNSWTTSKDKLNLLLVVQNIAIRTNNIEVLGMQR